MVSGLGMEQNASALRDPKAISNGDLPCHTVLDFTFWGILLTHPTA